MKQETKNAGQTFARICSVTGQGMWEGWVFGEGEAYAIDLKSADKLATERGFKDMAEAYEEGVCYWTDWGEDEAENTQYIEINGVFYDYAGEDAPLEIYGTEYKPIK
jgi:hypothetical protein